MRLSEARAQIVAASAANEAYPCLKAVKFVARVGGLEQAWKTCTIPGWMIYLLNRSDYFSDWLQRGSFSKHIGAWGYNTEVSQAKVDRIRKLIPEYPI